MYRGHSGPVCMYTAALSPSRQSPRSRHRRGCQSEGHLGASYVEQIGRELFLDREEGEELGAYASRLLQQLEFMIEQLDERREALRKAMCRLEQASMRCGGD